MKLLTTLIAAAVLSTGCATITSGTSQDINIKTDQACTATRGDQVATITPEWPTLKVNKAAGDITLVCGDKTHTIESETTTAGWVSVWLLDGGLVDMTTGAMWAYPTEVDARVAP